MLKSYWVGRRCTRAPSTVLHAPVWCQCGASASVGVGGGVGGVGGAAMRALFKTCWHDEDHGDIILEMTIYIYFGAVVL